MSDPTTPAGPYEVRVQARGAAPDEVEEITLGTLDALALRLADVRPQCLAELQVTFREGGSAFWLALEPRTHRTTMVYTCPTCGNGRIESDTSDPQFAFDAVNRYAPRHVCRCPDCQWPRDMCRCAHNGISAILAA
jgi:hypothetical protein